MDSVAFAVAAGVALAASALRKKGVDESKSFTPLRFDWDDAAIIAAAHDIIAKTEAVLDAIGSVPLDKVTYENTVLALDNLNVEVNAAETSATFVKEVGAEKHTRDAGTRARALLSDRSVKWGLRRDVYDRCKAFQDKAADPRSGIALDPEERRLVDHTVRDFRRRGVHLDAEKRGQMEALETEIKALCIEYSRNLDEVETKLAFSRDQLAGLPDRFLASLPVGEGGKLMCSLDTPVVMAISTRCSVEATRAAVEKAYNSRCIGTNAALLEKVAGLRREAAKVMGYATHAHRRLEVNVARTPETVIDFLETLSKRLDPLVDAELAELRKLKAADVGGGADASSVAFGMHDFRYYMRVRTEAEFDIDTEALKEYFPLDVVKQGMLDIYSTLLSLRFEQVARAHVWHPDVTLWRVTEKADREGAKAGDLVGYFYFDLHPRPGKYGHAACFDLINPCRLGAGENGGLGVKPVAAMVCNFSPPSKDAPSLLSHMEVTTFFHELGHVMHHICSRTRLHKFASFSVETDFVEAPSQMLENWCWEDESLRLLSGHYTDHSKKLPADICKRLAASKTAHAGLLNKRQLLFALFDQNIHSRTSADEAIDTAAVLDEYHRTVMRIPQTPGTNMSAGFGHMVGGYDAQYYGYMWSEVWSADFFFTRFKAEGLLNARTGADYRRCILQPGGSKDGIELARSFLGREPTQDAFLRSKGLEA